MKQIIRFLLCMIIGLPVIIPCFGQEQLNEASFITPPNSAKPNVYWYFLDDQISREGITKDLEEMKKVGIGGTLMFNISNSNSDYNNKSAGPLNYVPPGVK